MSSSGIVSISSFNLLFFAQVLTVLTTTIKYNEYVTDKGKNISIPCEVEGSIMWVKEIGNDSKIIQTGHILVLTNVLETDAGLYVCLYSDVNETSSETNVIPTTNVRVEDEYREYLKANLTVRTPPGPVSELYFKPSTVLGFLVWRFNKKNSGGYPVKSFTTAWREVSSFANVTNEWEIMDPINISPNVRQMEVYHLLPNRTYEFRIWANNQLGPGEIVTTNVTTLPETTEKDLIRLVAEDLKSFDVRVWFAAVGVFFGTLTILAIGLCTVWTKEYIESSSIVDDEEDGLHSIDLIPNIILNPGFCEPDPDGNDEPYSRTIIFGEDDESEGYDESDKEEKISFKRKFSNFFTAHTIKRI